MDVKTPKCGEEGAYRLKKRPTESGMRKIIRCAFAFLLEY